MIDAKRLNYIENYLKSPINYPYTVIEYALELITEIRRLHKELDEKKAEFIRMENAWRKEVQKLRLEGGE